MEQNNNTVDAAETEIALFADRMESVFRFVNPAEKIVKLQKYDRETIETLLQDANSNYASLIKVSRYFFHRSLPYRKLLYYYATMIDLNNRTVIPNIDFTKSNIQDNVVLKSYWKTLNLLKPLNLDGEFLKIFLTCWREDVFFGCTRYDGDGIFFLPLDPEFCRITGVFDTGDFQFHMNMKFFDSRKEVLELWGEPFTKMYDEYKRTSEKWILMPEEYTACFKINIQDLYTYVPPFAGLLPDLANLAELGDIQAIADEQEIFKLIVARMETMSGAHKANDWKVSPEVSERYYRQMAQTLPDYAGYALSPNPIDVVHFDNNKTNKDINKVKNATQTLYNTSGGAQILNSSTITGTVAWKGVMKHDTLYGISALLPQVEGWLNRFVAQHVSKPAKIKMFKISPYTKDDFKASLLSDALYGVPTKLALNALNGYSESETMAMNYLEENILELSKKFVPLQSTYTQSGKTDTSNDDPDTDEAEASREKRDSAGMEA